jgi:hypothetical protein
MRDRLREDPLPCPNCHSNLVELERSDVLIDACPKCRGVWLDRGELDRILDRERRAASGVVDDDQDFLRELGGRPRATAPPRTVTRDDDRDRFSGDRDRDRSYDDRPRRRKRSLFEDLFDFD